MLPVFGGISGSTNATVIIDFNTTNDSWWMFHFQPTTNTHSTFEYHQRQLVDVSLPTYNKHPLHFRIPPTTVGGCFTSNLQQTPTPLSNTTNDSWWIVQLQPIKQQKETTSFA